MYGCSKTFRKEKGFLRVRSIEGEVEVKGVLLELTGQGLERIRSSRKEHILTPPGDEVI